MRLDDDLSKLDRAAELVLDVIARNRGDDLRVVALFNDAVQDIKVGRRYLGAAPGQPQPRT